MAHKEQFHTADDRDIPHT